MLVIMMMGMHSMDPLPPSEMMRNSPLLIFLVTVSFIGVFSFTREGIIRKSVEEEGRRLLRSAPDVAGMLSQYQEQNIDFRVNPIVLLRLQRTELLIERLSKELRFEKD
jgi:hypothetical protein